MNGIINKKNGTSRIHDPDGDTNERSSSPFPVFQSYNEGVLLYAATTAMVVVLVVVLIVAHGKKLLVSRSWLIDAKKSCVQNTDDICQKWTPFVLCTSLHRVGTFPHVGTIFFSVSKEGRRTLLGPPSLGEATPEGSSR